MSAKSKRAFYGRRRRDDWDGAWKEAITLFFEDLIVFFFPAIHAQIDWTRGFEFMDTALKSIARASKMGGRHADKLVKVRLLNGNERWLLIHIEVQAQHDLQIPERMTIYNCRAFELHKVDVYSIAILADDDKPEWRENTYRHAIWDCELTMTYPVIKLNDYRAQMDELRLSKNPIAHIVLAFLKAQDTRRMYPQRRHWKLELMKNLYALGFDKQKIEMLHCVIDRLMDMPDNEEWKFNQELVSFEEELEMPFITSMERMGIKKGLKEGRVETAREWIVGILSKRFGNVPVSIERKVGSLDNISQLNELRDWAITTDSLQTFPLKKKHIK